MTTTILDKLPKKEAQKLIKEDARDQISEARQTRLSELFLQPIIWGFLFVVIVISQSWIMIPILFFSWYPAVLRVYRTLQKIHKEISFEVKRKGGE